MSAGKSALLITGILFIPLMIGLFLTLSEPDFLWKSSPSATPDLALTGQTMGTTWRVVLSGTAPTDALFDAIQHELDRVNEEMSHYRADSQISAFNESTSTDWMPVAAGFAQTMSVALDVAQRSEGALDVTLGPLIALWGFGAKGMRTTAPTDEEIAAAAALMGLDQLAVRNDPPALRKARGNIRVNLSAVAKGHGVDRVCALLDARGIANYFVEIGGEVRAKGKKPERSWHVALERPDEIGRSVDRTLPLDDAALATSGDYRNFFRDHGHKYSHTIDPRTGRPITHGLASVSVIATTCAEADAWATALTVLGPTEGLRIAEKEGLAALLLERTDDGFLSLTSTKWRERFPN